MHTICRYRRTGRHFIDSGPAAELIRMKIHVNLAAREVQFMWHVLPGAFQLLTSRVLERAKSRIASIRGSYSCPRSTTLSGQRKAIQKPVYIMPTKWQHLRPTSCHDTGAFWDHVRKYVMGRKFQVTPKDDVILSHCRWLTLQVSHFASHISSDRAIHLRKGGSNNHFKGTVGNKKDSHQYHAGNQFTMCLQSNLSVV